MACGCGGTNGGSGGCGGDKPLANPLLETELAHELPQAAASAVVEFDPAPAAPGADAEPLLIASSEQDWPRIRVNGVLIEPGDVFFTATRNTGNFIRLGYQSIPADQIDQGIKALAKAMHSI